MQAEHRERWPKTRSSSKRLGTTVRHTNVQEQGNEETAVFQDGVQVQDLPVRLKHAAVAGLAAPAASAGPAELAQLRL